MRAARWVVVLAALVAAFVGYRWWNSPDRQIRRVLDDIATRLSHDQPVTGLAAVGALAGLQDDFALDVVIEPGPPAMPLEGRDMLLAAAARLVSATPSLRLDFADAQIAVGADGTSARVACSVTAQLRDTAGRETVDVREMMIEMRIENGRWVVQRATAVNAIEPVS